MKLITTKDSIFLFLGDLIFFVIALWVSLTIRYWGFPSFDSFLNNFLSFFFVFPFWILTFFLLDLYSKRSIIFHKTFAVVIFKAQAINSLIAVLFFYFIPGLNVAPKIILFIDLFVSFALVFFWRWYVSRAIYKTTHERAILLGSGPDVDDFKKELSGNFGYHLEIVNQDKTILPKDKKLLKYIEDNLVNVVILDLHDPTMNLLASDLYKIFFTKVHFLDLETLYEEVFDRVPLSLINDRWFLENITLHSRREHEMLKRLMDIIISLFVGVIFLPFLFLGILLVKLGDRGNIFIVHDRVGRGGELFKTYKLRTMLSNDTNKPTFENDPRVTRVGKFLRKARIDELPQLWNVIRGEMSLVGPRPELPHFVEKYRAEIPYYDVRHMISPGLSGWAQIHFHTPAYSAATNAVKLSYELYYLKNRSFLLDLKIAIKTIRTLLLRKGI